MRKFGGLSDNTKLGDTNLDSNEITENRGMFLVEEEVDPLEELLREGGFYQPESKLSSHSIEDSSSFYFLKKKGMGSSTNLSESKRTEKIEDKINGKIDQLDEYLNRMKYMLNEINLGSDTE